jgi:thiosulfate reductase cytochrome b subunit
MALLLLEKELLGTHWIRRFKGPISDPDRVVRDLQHPMKSDLSHPTSSYLWPHDRVKFLY